MSHKICCKSSIPKIHWATDQQNKEQTWIVTNNNCTRSCTPTKIYAKTFQSRINLTCSWCRQLCIPIVIQTYLPQEGINRLDRMELRGWRFAKKNHNVQDEKNMTFFLMLLIYNHELLGIGEKANKKSRKWCISFNNFKPNSRVVGAK